MGKLKKSTALKAQKKKPKKVKLTIEELLTMAEECIDSFELESAYYYVKQALDLDPKHVEALEMMASVQMEMGNTENAKTIYEKLAELSPNEGFSKYMCLAQLSLGNEAVEYYKKGIELMLFEFGKQEQEQASASPQKVKPSTSKAANDSDEEEEEDEGFYKRITKTDISTAYGSIAEIYLTDLCMEDDAADNCKIYLDKSLEYDPKNPESLQLLASYWLSKDEIEEAKTSILASLDCWLPRYREAEESGPLVDPSQAISLTYDARINTSRILTEVQEFDQALVVLEQLIEEDDEVVVTWYMLGWVNYCKGEDYHSNAKFYLKRADELASKIKYDQKYLDDSLKSHIKELLEKLAAVPSDDEDEEDLTDATNENEDEYETDEEEEECEDEQENGNGHADSNNNNHFSQNQNGADGNSKLAALKAACSKSMSKSRNQAEEPMELT